MGVTRRRVAVVGAGMAGLVAARRLADVGCEVTLFEKSRGPGGRCATRRSDFGAFHHGVASFAAVSPAFCAELTHWLARGWVTPLPPAGAVAPAVPAVPAVRGVQGVQGVPAVPAACLPRRWVGLPTINALARQLAQGLALQTGHTVHALQPAADGGWQLATAEQGLLATRFDTVLLALPAEQARPLCAHSTVLQQALQPVHSQPCWTLMLAWAEPSLGPVPRLEPGTEPARVLAEVLDLSTLAEASPTPAGRAGSSGPALEPGAASGTRWVLHAQPGWSTTHLELPAADATALLMRALMRALMEAQAQTQTHMQAQPPMDTRASPLPPPAYIAAHRWRYARVADPLPEACGWDATLRLGCAGDAWAGRPSASGAGPEGVERAWLSGLALAEAALRAA